MRNVPVMGMISRLAQQKGIDLLAGIIDQLLDLDVQLAMLGSGEPEYEKIFLDIKARYPEKAGIYLGFNPVLAQRIYAGADLFLMPSRFEPCGLGQLIAMRYGNIPVVRATGGLADTVHDYNPVTGTGNGFVFLEYDKNAFYQVIRRALNLYWHEPAQWQKLARNAMEQDFSWARSAVEYLQLYYEAINRHLSRSMIA